jgi:deoxyadenosine/deoxycytidine kinase
LIYLWAPVEVLLQRIKSRGREIESGISHEYLTLLESFYTEWLRNFDLCPVLTIRSNDLNFVDDADDLETVIDRINKALAGRDELVLGD